MALAALYRNRRENELQDFKLEDVFEKLEMDTAAFQDLFRCIGLLATPLCPTCRGSMTKSQAAVKWRCGRRACRTGRSGETTPSVPVGKGSFFEHTNLPEAEIFALSYFWLHELGTVDQKE
ncbi:hypothetical protein Q1695_000790 [Nippostrongylus brasiliensis]|nr:hypothetical protein Q1695_000790 [Nippostrongylus brasiliensis]